MLQRREDKLTFVCRWFLYFVGYSVIGWCYEVFLEVVVYKWGFSNRGFLFGPYCPVYGFGALICFAILWKLIHSRVEIRLPLRDGLGRRRRLNLTPLLVFLGVVVLTTVIELIASYIMEWLTGSWMWDYERFSFDFQGRIAPNPSIRFGIGGVAFVYLIQPLLEWLTRALGSKAVKVVAVIAAMIMGADFAVKIMSML